MTTELNQWEIEILRQAASASDGRIYTTCLDSDSGSTLPANIWARSLEASGYLHLEYIDNIGGRYTITPAGQILYNEHNAAGAPSAEPTDFLDAAERSSDLLASVQTEAVSASEKIDEQHVREQIARLRSDLKAIASGKTGDRSPADVAELAQIKLDVLDRMAFEWGWGLYGDGYEAGMKDANKKTAADENDAAIIEQKFVDAMAGIQEFFDARPEVRRSFGGGSKVDKNLIAYATRLEEENRALQAANRRLQDKLADEARLHGEQSEEIGRLGYYLVFIASGMVGDRSPESIARQALEA